MIDKIYINALLADAAYIDFIIPDHVHPETGEILPTAKLLFTNSPSDEPKGRRWTEGQFNWFIASVGCVVTQGLPLWIPR